jgi:hypothetical protein
MISERNDYSSEILSLKCLPFLLLGVFCACNGSRTELIADAPVQTAAVRSETVSLPNGMSPIRMFTTKSLSLLIKGAADADHRSLYSWGRAIRSRRRPAFSSHLRNGHWESGKSQIPISRPLRNCATLNRAARTKPLEGTETLNLLLLL